MKFFFSKYRIAALEKRREEFEEKEVKSINLLEGPRRPVKSLSDDEYGDTTQKDF